MWQIRNESVEQLRRKGDMARSEHSIRMDFEKAKAAAARLDDIADSIASMMSGEYEDSLDSVNQSWRGDNATFFLTKSNELGDKIGKIVSDLKAAADVIRRIAQNTYDSEMRALEIARQREYQSKSN